MFPLYFLFFSTQTVRFALKEFSSIVTSDLSAFGARVCLPLFFLKKSKVPYAICSVS